MKALLISLIVLAYSASSFACSCKRPNFTVQDRKEAILKFMNDKLGVEENDVLQMKTVNERDYLPLKEKILMAPFVPFAYLSDKQIRKTGLKKSCEYGCSLAQHSDRDYLVTFARGNEICSVDLRVIMTSAFNDTDFKSKVKQKYAPTCL